MLPFSADPVAQAQLQQQVQQEQIQQAQLAQQLDPQGWFGNLISQVGRPLGGAIGGLFGNAGLGNTIGGIAKPGRPHAALQRRSRIADGQSAGLVLRLSAPAAASAAIAATAATTATAIRATGPASRPASASPGRRPGRLPQGWFGNLIGQVGQPLGGAIGGLFGNSGLGSTIGGIA
ncbi:hypothetical protein LP420_34540 [Massilia sp. B-10]|nr:hypothetical protein LP420_34540 [Massilia sp. B-10]